MKEQALEERVRLSKSALPGDVDGSAFSDSLWWYCDWDVAEYYIQLELIVCPWTEISSPDKDGWVGTYP